MGKIVLACGGAALAVAVVAIALAGGSSADERDPTNTGAVRGDGSRSLACTNASFWLGREQGTVEFNLQCDGIGAGGTSHAYIARFSDSRPGLESDFQAVSSGGENVTCRLRRGIASCVAPQGEKGEVHGELRVPPGSECVRTISAYVVLPSRCGNSPACNLEFATASLFRGRPSGCA